MEKLSKVGNISDTTKQLLLIAGVSLMTGVGINLGVNYFIQRLREDIEKENSEKSEDKSDILRVKKISTNVLEEEANIYRLHLEARLGNDNDLLDELRFLDSITSDIEKIPHLAALLKLRIFPKIVSPLLGDSKFRSVYGGEGFIPEESFVDQNSYVLQATAIFGPENPFTEAKKYLRGGPRKHIFFSPNEVRACIVTCGRVSPGLNVIISEIHNCLYYNYNVQNIHGVKYGYRGFYAHDWKRLKPKKLTNIHHQGGTILGSSKTAFELDKLMASITEHRINQIYCIGGDGTLRGVSEIFKQICDRKLKISIVGIGKSIEHDIPVIDRPFGFATTVEEAARAIQSAVVEATGFENAVGVVKLMGRHAGFIAMYASLANREVNVCLVPEFPYELEGPKGLLEYVRLRVIAKRSCIVVVSEGSGKSILDADLRLKELDKYGHPKMQDVGIYLRERIIKHCKEQGLVIAMKYIDPTYMIRDVAATAFDQQMCSQLAQNAVHGAMSGWTGFGVGNISGRSCYIPLKDILKKRSKIEANDSDWQKLLTSTGQPSFLNGEQYVNKNRIQKAELSAEEEESQ